MTDEAKEKPHQDTRPDPDPTALTTANLQREIYSLRELLETRLDAIDARFLQLHAEFDRIPDVRKEAIAHLKDLMEERFDSIQVQFKERDVRVEQTARDTKVAVDAALQAAEKARTSSNESFSLSIAKSENATTKQIDQQAIQMTTSTQALVGQITDVKERLTRIEGTGEGMATNKIDHRATSGIVIAIIAVSVSLIIGVAGILIAVLLRR